MKVKRVFMLSLLFTQLTVIDIAYAQAESYPTEKNRQLSPGKTTYYIDPAKGNDQNSGKNTFKAWKTFMPANQLIFSQGDKLMVSPGRYETSLMLMGKGSNARPVNVIFQAGRYELYDKEAYRAKLNISNTNDVPDGQKAIAFCIAGSRNVVVNGAGARFVLHAKMIETFVDHSDNVTISGLSYDYETPTVSEFKVIAKNDSYADLQVNKDSHYSVTDSVLTWEGEGWSYKNSWYWQQFDPATGYLTRTGPAMDNTKFADIGDHRLRIFFRKDPGLKTGFVYQTRDVTRDCAGIFMQRSKTLTLKNIRIYFMHGMGVVSQFCQNITMDSVVVKPDGASGRTCAAWADILHFSGCRGQIEVKNSYLSGANDDAINVHGVHLRIIDRPVPNQLHLRFMHGQTYGFNAYQPGDSIELVHGNSLLAFGSNVVIASKMLNDKDILITLKNPVNGTLRTDDAVENITWTPRLYVHNTTITSIPTRGILVTTRRKVLIEHNRFLRTASPGVLVEDDAEGWYESGSVKDLTVRNNTFFECGEPAISIHPENTVSNGPVHKNIAITGNTFTLTGGKALFAKSTNNIIFNGNMITLPANADKTQLTEFKDCTMVDLADNKIVGVK